MQIARLKKNSSNSSKPPSSDIVKPPKITVSRKIGKRRQGAQPGHPRHERAPFEEEEIDRQITRREHLRPAHFDRKLAALRDRLIHRFQHSPGRAGVCDLRERFRLHPQEFFTFVTTPGVEPTNNMTERTIRYLIIDRRITQGTRGNKGQRWCERIWTTIGTCEAQGRPVFDFLCAALSAHFRRESTPSLMTSGP